MDTVYSTGYSTPRRLLWGIVSVSGNSNPGTLNATLYQLSYTGSQSFWQRIGNPSFKVARAVRELLCGSAM